MRYQLRQVLPHPTDPTAALVELTQGYWATIDAADAPEVGRFNWHVKKVNPRKTYAGSALSRRLPPPRAFYLHRFIATLMGLPPEMEVDHRDGNGLDCRRRNLRAADTSQNRVNTGPRRDNSTGEKNVQRNRSGSFIVRIKANGVSHWIGSFETLGDAAQAARTARSRLHGEFANHGRN